MRTLGWVMGGWVPRWLAACAVAASASAQQPPQESFDPVQRFDLAQNVGIDQKLGERVPLDLRFKDEQGQEVELGKYFGERPVILSLVYFGCPMLCTEVLNEQTRVLRVLALEAGRDFEMVSVSIDARETPELALKKKRNQVDSIDREGVAGGWHFLVGDEANIQRLASAVGFRYVYDAKQDQFAHAGGLMILTPEGVLSRYIYGIEYPARDVKFALVEASQGKVGSFVDRVLLLCFHYDPKTGRYTIAALTTLRIVGGLFLLALGGYIVFMLRRDVLRRRASLRAAGEAS